MEPKITTGSNTNIQPSKHRKQPKTKKIDIAKAMMEFADKNAAAVGKEGFQSLLKQINKNNVIDIINEYDRISPDESIIEMILDEAGSNDEEIKTAVKGLFALLCDKAKDAGVDSDTISNLEKEFDTELNKQLGNNGFWGQVRSLISTDSTRLDNIVRTLIQLVENLSQLSEYDKDYISIAPSTALQTQTNKILTSKLDKANKDFEAQVGKNGIDGWAGNVADSFSKIWNNESYGNKHGNTADLVEKDLNKFKEQLHKLEVAKQDGDEAYKAKFKEIFGVAYSPVNIIAYQNAESRYLLASDANAQEDNFNSEFKLLLNSNGLQEEGEMMITDVSLGVATYHVNATKEQVYKREYEKFAKLFGEGGEAVIQEKFKEAGVENESIEEKFEILQELAKAVSSDLHNNTMKITGGVDFDSVQRQYDNCYKAAFGLDNDIMKRVTDYNISQQRGAGVVKSAVVMAAVTAAGFAAPAMGIVGLAGVSAGTTAFVEVTDAATQKRNITALKEDGLGAYLESVGKNTDWSGIAKASLTSGGMMLAIGGISYPIAHLCRISASAAGLTGKALDIATGVGTNTLVTSGMLGAEYLMKGEISTETAVFTVIMSVVGSTIQVIQINKAYNIAAESANTNTTPQNTPLEKTLSNEEIQSNINAVKQKSYETGRSNLDFMEYNNPQKYGINSYEDLLNSPLIDNNEKLMIERTYNNAVQKGYQDFLDSNLDVLIGFAKGYKNTNGELVSLYENLSVGQLEAIKYAKTQYNEGLIDPKYINAFYDRVDMSTPIEIYQYVDHPENLPDIVYSKKDPNLFWTKETCLKEIENVRLIREFLNTQSTPNDMTVYRRQCYSIMKKVQVGDSNLADVMQNAVQNGTVDDVLQIFNKGDITVIHENHIGTSLTSQDIFSSGDNAIRWEIDVPAGSKGLFVESIMPDGAIYGETEFLVQMGSTCKIKSAEFKNGTWYLKADLLQ